MSLFQQRFLLQSRRRKPLLESQTFVLSERKTLNMVFVAIDPLGEIPWKSGKPDGRPGLEDARIIVIIRKKEEE